LTTIIDYSNINLDNVLIVNTVIPLLRGNWHLPEIAKFWKYLTFKGEYRLPELICMHDLQVRIPTPKDKHTIKNSDTLREEKRGDGGSLDCEEEGETATIHRNHKENQNSAKDAMLAFITEILEAIVDNQRDRVTERRDLDLLDGVYNVLL
jgi:hypothetical protein